MMNKNDEQLLKSITPVINSLSSMWFPPDKKSPDGYFYACPYCDSNFSAHNKHDDDCLLQCAKNVKDIWFQVDENDNAVFSPITKKKRSKADVRKSKDFRKVMAVLEKFFSPLMVRLVPFHYTPENEGVICECNMGDPESKEHNKKCVRQRMARIISDYYNPSN